LPSDDGSEKATVPEMTAYDEFSLFHENAEEFGIPFRQPVVRRECVDLEEGRRLSALVWGEKAPEYVFIHGGAQNAHTWDTVLMALNRSAVAVDLPGHGHSDASRGGPLNLASNADAVAIATERLAPEAKAVIGMSLGAETAMKLAERHPALVRRLVLVDMTPGVTEVKAREITAFIDGPASFADFDSILERTVAHNPTRSVSSLRRGILHNAEQQPDGTWVWRYARHGGLDPEHRAVHFEEVGELWDVVSQLAMPVMLVRGMRPQSVVSDEDEAEMLRRQPSLRVEHVEDAGHSVQGDTPLELAALIADFAP
jgi:pimeloyl-ACP methyl ester carboxylesterase